MNWSTIETLPEVIGVHSHLLLGWVPEYGVRRVFFTPLYLEYDGVSPWTVEGFSTSVKPTHWMPLPEPPK